MPKETRYADYDDAPESAKVGIVKYAIRDKSCIFTGLTSSRVSPTTINAAEYVIRAIAETEGLDPRLITFYDLLTRRGYPDQPKPYEFVRLMIGYQNNQIHVVAWTPVECTPDILKLFGVVDR